MVVVWGETQGSEEVKESQICKASKNMGQRSKGGAKCYRNRTRGTFRDMMEPIIHRAKVCCVTCVPCQFCYVSVSFFRMERGKRSLCIIWRCEVVKFNHVYLPAAGRSLGALKTMGKLAKHLPSSDTMSPCCVALFEGD